MGVDLHILLAAAVTAEEAFELPARLSRAPDVVAACRAYDANLPSRRGHELQAWTWDDQLHRVITSPSMIIEAWASEYVGSVWLSGTVTLHLEPNQISLSPGPRLIGFATDYEGCQTPIRQLCRALVHELGADRVLYLPDSGHFPPEVGELYQVRFDDLLARLTAWGPPVSTIGALGFGDAVRSGFHYADGALRRTDGTAVSDAEIMPGTNRIYSGGVATYYDGTLVPPEELARPDLRGGFAYYVDDFHDLP